MGKKKNTERRNIVIVVVLEVPCVSTLGIVLNMLVCSAKFTALVCAVAFFWLHFIFFFFAVCDREIYVIRELRFYVCAVPLAFLIPSFARCFGLSSIYTSRASKQAKQLCKLMTRAARDGKKKFEKRF